MNGPWFLARLAVFFGTGRTKSIFYDQFTWPSAAHLVVLDYVPCIYKARDLLGRAVLTHGLRVEKLVGWSSPATGWIRLNTDGAFKPSSLSATAGGVIRDACEVIRDACGS